MNEYQADRSLSTMSNINLLSNDSISPMRDIMQCPLCVFTTSNRSEFTEHLISLCTPKYNNSEFKTTLARLSVVKSFLNQKSNDYSPLTLTAEYVKRETEETDESSSLHVSYMSNPQSNVSKRDNKNLREAKNCKQCNFVASTKMEYWEHLRCHIKGFTCSECSFVTKYKHHMNHHWLSVHDGSKPFKCKICLYACVSKSMLTSHLKKHSNIYPYRCADCAYRSKFCNALKKHLRNKEHRPAMVLNADGSPNPLSIIDVYGTKRGPKRKPASTLKQQKEVKNTIKANDTNDGGDHQLDSTTPSLFSSSFYSSVPHYLTITAINGTKEGINHWINHNNTNKNLNQSVANCTLPYSDLVAAFNLSNHILFRENATFCENIRKTDRNAQSDPSLLMEYTNVENKKPEIFVQNLPVTQLNFDATSNIELYTYSDSMKVTREPSTFVTAKTKSTDVPLDLRMTEVIGENQLQFQTISLTDTNAIKTGITGTSKRKGKAKKLERRAIIENTDQKPKQNKSASSESPTQENKPTDFRQVKQKVKDIKDEAIGELCDTVLTCHYCEIVFGNVIMYAAHMGCHSFDDPYTCNICGDQCTNKLSFFLHIDRSKH